MYEIELCPLTLWLPVLPQGLTRMLYRTVSVGIAALSCVGIALGFAGVSGDEGTLFQQSAQSVAVLLGLIG
jgi:hypothetical protein